MAADQKKAHRQGAAIAFVDESGLLMAPLVRRTLAPRGHPPVMLEGGGRREKVSVASALWLPPDRKSLRLSFQTLANQFFDPQYSALFLEALSQEVGGKAIVVWDGGPMHKGNPIREVLERYSDRLSLESLPPYAPQLNPVEPVWSWLKHSRLCNYAPQNALELERRVLAELEQASQDQPLLKGFFFASELPRPRTLLT